MADIPDEIHAPTRDDVVADAKNSWLVRSMEADPTKAVDVGPGTLPAVIAEVVGDLAMPHFANEVTAAKRWLVANVFGSDLERLALEKLGPDDGVRRPAYGGLGYAEAAKIEVGGMHADTTTVLVETKTGLRFRVVTEQDYEDGDPIAIIGIDTGPTTNLAAGTVLQFDSPPPGCSLTATILAQNDGTGALVGLTGGRDAETDVELQARIVDAQTNPRAAGNDAQIVQVAQKTGGVPVQKAWTIPAWNGPGSTSVPFTLRPDSSASRIPNSVQRGLVEADLKSAFPKDWTITVPALLTQNLSVSVGVTWLSAARGWTDLAQWPPHIPGDPVVVSAVSSSLALRAATGTSTTAPVAGQTIALFDLASKTFKRKRIASVTTIFAGTVWDLIFTDALGASDSFVPVVGALISPHSSSLARLVPPMISYTQTLGPGEMFASLPDPGGRRRRWPYSPDEWPSTVTNEGLVNAVKASGAIGDVEVLSPATPYATTVGTPGVSVYLLQFSDFAVYPQT